FHGQLPQLSFQLGVPCLRPLHFYAKIVAPRVIALVQPARVGQPWGIVARSSKNITDQRLVLVHAALLLFSLDPYASARSQLLPPDVRDVTTFPCSGETPHDYFSSIFSAHN